MPLVILFVSLLLTHKAQAQSCPYITEKSALTSLQEQASDLELKVYEKNPLPPVSVVSMNSKVVSVKWINSSLKLIPLFH